MTNDKSMNCMYLRGFDKANLLRFVLSATCSEISSVWLEVSTSEFMPNVYLRVYIDLWNNSLVRLI